MSTIRIAVRSWWTLALVAIVIALAFVLPATASAVAYSYPGYGYPNYGYGSGYGVGAIARNDYRGYAYITGVDTCPVNAYCIRRSVGPVFGFRWTNYGWQRYQLAQGRYYVTPYSGKWRWVMTGYGWLIVGDATVIVA